MGTNPWTTRDSDSGVSRRAASQEDTAGDSAAAPAEDGHVSYAEQFRASAGYNADRGEACSAAAAGQERSFQSQFMGDRESFEQEGNTAEQQEGQPDMTGEPSIKSVSSGKNATLRHKLEERRKATPEENLPVLPKKAHRQLNMNFRELSLVEGNLRGLERSICSVYCTSSFDKEGKTTTATSVAFGLSEFNNCDVLLIDTNYERPQLDRLMGMPGSPGLQELLAKTMSPGETILPTYYPHLYLLPAGEGNAALTGGRFAELLSEFTDNFDFVIIDGKTLFASSEVSNMATLVDSFLVIVQCEKTKWEVVQLAQEKLRNAGNECAGIILNQRRYYLPKIVYRLISRS